MSTPYHVLQAIMMVHDIASYSYLSSDAAIVLIILWHKSKEFMGGPDAITFFLIDTSGNAENGFVDIRIHS